MSFITPYLNKKKKIEEDEDNNSFSFFATSLRKNGIWLSRLESRVPAAERCLSPALTHLLTILNDGIYEPFPYGGSFAGIDCSKKHKSANFYVDIHPNKDYRLWLTQGNAFVAAIGRPPKSIVKILTQNRENFLWDKGRIERVHMYTRKDDSKDFSIKVRFWFDYQNYEDELLDDKISNIIEEI